MSLLAKIQADALAARKERKTLEATLLTTLLAEAARKGKDDGNRESTDEEVVAVVNKFIKNNDDAIKALWVPEKVDTNEARCAKRDQLQMEQVILFGYLPKQASKEEIASAVNELVAGLAEKSMKQVGAVMSQLQKRFEGNFDKALASTLVKAALTS